MFQKGQSGNPQGRPPKPALWKSVEEDLRTHLPYMLRLKESEATRMMHSDPTLAQKAVYDYIKKQPADVIARFLPQANEQWANDPETVEIIAEAVMKKLDAAAGDYETNANA